MSELRRLISKLSQSAKEYGRCVEIYGQSAVAGRLAQIQETEIAIENEIVGLEERKRAFSLLAKALALHCGHHHALTVSTCESCKFWIAKAQEEL
jgi:hypothetical protein